MTIHNQTPKNIMFAGDWHGEYQQAINVLQAANELDCHHILQVGDFGVWNTGEAQHYLKRLNLAAKHYDLHIYFVDGNHEDHPHLRSFPQNPDKTHRVRSNISYLPRGFTWTWGSTSFLALGGAYSVDREQRTPNYSFFYEETLTQEECDSIPQNHIDVLVCHDSPHDAPNPILDDPLAHANGLRAYGQNSLQQAANHQKLLTTVTDKVDPTLIVHGHYHRAGQKLFTRKTTGTTCDIISLDEGSASLNRHTLFVTMKDLEELTTENRNNK